MATTLQFRRGNNTTAGGVTGANGEIYINTEHKTIHVHDGVTAGGFQLANASSVANASNLTTGTVPAARLGSGTANNSTYLRGDGTWAAVGSNLSAVAGDILPSIDAVYDVGAANYRWNDVFVGGSVDVNGAQLTGSNTGAVTILSTTSDVVVGSLLADDILISNNVITPDAITAAQYLGQKGVVVVDGNIDAAGEWIQLPIAQTTTVSGTVTLLTDTTAPGQTYSYTLRAARSTSSPTSTSAFGFSFAGTAGTTNQQFLTIWDAAFKTMIDYGQYGSGPSYAPWKIVFTGTDVATSTPINISIQLLATSTQAQNGFYNGSDSMSGYLQVDGVIWNASSFDLSTPQSDIATVASLPWGTWTDTTQYIQNAEIQVNGTVTLINPGGDVITLPLSTGTPGLIRYNKDVGAPQIYMKDWTNISMGVQPHVVLTANDNGSTLEVAKRYLVDVSIVTALELPNSTTTTLTPGDTIEFILVAISGGTNTVSINNNSLSSDNWTAVYYGRVNSNAADRWVLLRSSNPAGGTQIDYYN